MTTPATAEITKTLHEFLDAPVTRKSSLTMREWLHEEYPKVLDAMASYHLEKCYKTLDRIKEKLEIPETEHLRFTNGTLPAFMHKLAKIINDAGDSDLIDRFSEMQDHQLNYEKNRDAYESYRQEIWPMLDSLDRGNPPTTRDYVALHTAAGYHDDSSMPPLNFKADMARVPPESVIPPDKSLEIFHFFRSTLFPLIKNALKDRIQLSPQASSEVTSSWQNRVAIFYNGDLKKAEGRKREQ